MSQSNATVVLRKPRILLMVTCIGVGLTHAMQLKLSFKSPFEDVHCRNTVKISTKVLTELQCAYLCSQRNGCVGFFHNKDESACLHIDPAASSDCSYFNLLVWTSWKNGIVKMSNLADDHQNVSQSTTKLGRSAGRAVDGNISPEFSSDSCTHTDDNDPNPWWQVTLDQVYPIGRIEIINRQDEYANRLRGLTIKAGFRSADKLCGTFDGPADDSRAQFTIVCDNILHGDIVRITKTGPGILTLCEVQVYTFQ